MNENMFKTIVDASAVTRAWIIANGARFHVAIELAPWQPGHKSLPY